MLNQHAIEQIREQAQVFWDREVQQPHFISKIDSKNGEFGQTNAQYVQAETAKHLTNAGHSIWYEHYAKGKNKDKPKLRPMGDFWIGIDGAETQMFYPVNVKTRKYVKDSQPNIVSMNRLLNALIRCEIDTYYLMIIKFTLSDAEPVEVTPNVHLVNMLDYLDCISFDAGTGQIMLDESTFYKAVKDKHPVSATIEDKVAELLGKYKKGIEELFRRREKSVAKTGTTHGLYVERSTRNLDQKKLKLRQKR